MTTTIISNVDYRRHTRLRHVDYRSCRVYFVTLCVTNRDCVFGSVQTHQMSLTRRGMVARDCWLDIPNHHPHVELDAFVIMPNHLHGILLFVGDPVVATPASRVPVIVPPASPVRAKGPSSGSLGAVIGSYKSVVTRTINRLRPGTATNLWQPNYYDHIVRGDFAHDRIRAYIEANPDRWSHDSQNPAGDGTDNLVAFIRELAELDLRLPEDRTRDAGVATTGGK